MITATERDRRQLPDFIANHSRTFGQNSYVYPVISRRSKGLSIGINLNLDGGCNFNCAYCQVDRTLPRQPMEIDLEQLGNELRELLLALRDGRFWQSGEFANVPPALRRLDNLAIAGDGEPTLCRWFAGAITVVGGVKNQLGLRDLKTVLVTNASRLGDEPVRQSLRLFDVLGGEVWAKLDAGSEAVYQAVNRTRVPFQQILANLVRCGQERPLVIQSMFLHLPGLPLTDADFESYLDRVAGLMVAGCQVKGLQLYTLSRPPAQDGAAPLSDTELDGLVECVRRRLPKLPAEAFYAA